MKNRIKEILLEKNLTSIELANMVGISRVSLSNIINDKQEASANTLNSIAEKLDVPFWQLFVNKDEIIKEITGGDRCPHCGQPIKIRIDKGE